jgi:hypothetical protein
MNRQANASAKSKELQPNAQADTVAAHLLLPNRTLAHPPPYIQTGDNLKDFFDRKTVIKTNFTD